MKNVLRKVNETQTREEMSFGRKCLNIPSDDNYTIDECVYLLLKHMRDELKKNDQTLKTFHINFYGRANEICIEWVS